jgi:AcrR family transcriptional regulator
MMDTKEIRENAVRDAKTNFILDAARKVFAEKGFHDCRLEDIAAAAGFSKAALYNYYEDKETIFLSLAVRDFDEMIAALQKESNPDAPICENLEHILKTIFSFFGEHFAFLLTIANMQSSFPLHTGKPLNEHHKQLTGKFHEKFRQILGAMTAVITNARQKGEVSTTLEDAVIAGYISSLVRGAVFDWKLAGKMGDMDSEIKRIVNFTCHGLGIKDNG